MNLGDLWGWEKRKLGCRIRVETQNPALDEIRERLSKMTGVEVPELMMEPLDNGKLQRPKTTGPGKALRTGHVRADALSRPNTAALSDGTQRSIMAASTASLMAYQHDANPGEISKTRKNIYKKFFQIPRSPPAKIMLDLQKDRLRLPPSKSAVDQVRERRAGTEALLIEPLDGVRPKTTQQTSRRRRPNGSRSNEAESPDARDKKKEANKEQTVDSKEHVFPPYSGDLFMTRGVYMGGIIYQSRLSDHTSGEARRRKLMEHDKPTPAQESVARELKLKQEEEEKATLDTTPQRRDAPGAHEAKLHCANSLASWSTHGENAVRLAEEGAVSAALVLSKDENADVRRACATAFKNMSQHAELCEQLVKHTAVPVISDLGVAAKDITVSRDCGLALVNLTIMDGIEAKLVEDGVVIALMSLMNQHEELAELCSRGLFNLTCVDQPYMYMERVIKAFVSLASSTMAAVKHVCAAALCNLSDIKPVRSRIVEEGVVQVVGLLARGAEARTRRVCAIVLHSLASTRTCRADMVSKGAVQVLYALSSDVDTITLHYIASAIIRLAMEDQNLPRLVHEGGVTALCNICLRCPRDVSTTQLCASALSLLSQQAIGRQAIVQEGCVPALVTLLHEASDASTLRHGLSALTNLLVDEANHEQVLGQGGVAAIIVLCSHISSEIREACALALFNFSRGEAARERGVSASAIPAIIALSRLPEPRTRMRCAATLCKLASVEANVSLMVEEGVVPAFIDMLQTRDQEIVKHCCAALCRLAHEGSSAVTIAEGAVPHVIAGCGEGSDAATRQSCCAVLSAVSAHEPCRRPLCAMGTLQALVALARDRAADDTTRLRCAVAFANLSHEPTVQGEMVAAGIVPVVAELSNSYCEENQLYCARALCNLGCHAGSEEAIVEQGGVAALMMICMVRAVSHFTKQVCAKALLNLLCTPAVRENWLPHLAKEGLVQAVSVLSRLSEEETMCVCASIFCTLSAQGPMGRKLLVERRSTLTDVFGLMRSRDRTTQVVCGKTACNLLGHVDSQQPAVRAGAVSVLTSLCTLGDPEAEVAAADAYFLIAGEASCRQEMVEANVLPVLITNARSPNAATRQSCLRVLAHLAWWTAVRAPLLAASIVPVLVVLVEQTCGSAAANELDKKAGNLKQRVTIPADDLVQRVTIPADDLVQDLTLNIFTYMTFASEEHRVIMVRDDIVPALGLLYQKLTLSGDVVRSSRIRMFVAASLRSLAAATEALDKLVEDGAVRLLCDIMCAEQETGNAEVYEHCARAMYSVAREQRFNGILFDQGALEAVPRLGKLPACYALAAATLHLLSLEPQHRELIVANSAARDLLLRLAEAPDDPHAGSTVQSCAQTFFWLSRCTAQAREELASAGLVPLLIRLSRHRDEKVASSCSEALKNLSSGGSGGIEEGTVSTLIAMTLSGGNTKKCAALDADSLAELPAKPLVEDKYKPSEDLLPQSLLGAFEPHTVSVMKMVGGIAGAGPPPPEPPEMDVQDTLNLSFLDNADAMEDDENMGASMMFAKITADSTSTAA